MSKEEFVSILNIELERLYEEQKTVQKRADDYNHAVVGIYLNQKDKIETNYYNHLLIAKLKVLRVLIELPAYARIEAMSDIELEDYKSEKLKELELKIKELSARKIQEEESLSRLEIELEAMKGEVYPLFGADRERLMVKINLLRNQINAYSLKNDWGIIANTQKEINKIEREIEELKNKTIEEIKEELTKGKKDKHNREFSEVISSSKKFKDSDVAKLLSAVGDDPEKAHEMAKKMIDLNHQDERIASLRAHMGFGLSTPRALIEELKRIPDIYNTGLVSTNDPDRLAMVIDDFHKRFSEEKKMFNQEFTLEKLTKLNRREWYYTGPEVDFDYLDTQKDKIPEGMLDELRSLVVQREILSKKIFKSKDVKLKIENLDGMIERRKISIYQLIIGWYHTQNNELLGITSSLSFDGLELIKESLARVIRDVEEAEANFETIRENLEKAKADIEAQKAKIEGYKESIYQEMRELAGPEFQNEKLDIFTSHVKEENLGIIKSVTTNEYERKIIEQVQAEVQTQADVREAELRGISLEELYKLRRETLSSQITNDEDTYIEEQRDGRAR